MKQICDVIKQMISITDDELDNFLKEASVKQFQKQEILSKPDEVPNEVFFINKGIIRVMITDHLGKEHTIHFALENQFICDYSNFILSQPGFYTLHPTGKGLVSS